ncbi:glycosyltransferase, partial [Candidatus Peregrinibacteria bacterium]|nr:glycosyltransferase [Candidatus Peregrinibacteria bacterium]
MKYRIVIPLYNEEKNIEKLINRFPEKHIPSIIFINDGSSDQTKEILKKFQNITSLHHKIN